MIRVLTISAICVSVAAAQFPAVGNQTVLRGQVMSDQSLTGPLVVELHPLSGLMNKQQTTTDADGDFHMQDVEVGDYQLIVTDHQGRVLREQMLRVDKTGAPVEVRLPSATGAKPPAGSVTVASLQHKVPRQAMREYRAAAEARRRNNEVEVVEHLRNAIAIDPQFAAAHGDLGAFLLNEGDCERAMVQLDQAETLDPGNIAVALNRANCLARSGRLPEAEIAARRGVQLDGGSPRSRYMLGLVLANQKKFTRETIENLAQAAESFPEARVTAAQVLNLLGRNHEACEQLRFYLDKCKPESCKPVESWLARLSR